MDEFSTQKQRLDSSIGGKTMTETTYNVMMPDKGVPIKAWTKGVPLEDAARQQLLNVAQLPFIYKWVAAMPDVHWGIGATVGSVIPTRGAIIPAAVGVDIGCGMMAVQTSLHANHLPDNLHGIRTAIEKAVPHGRTDNGRANDRGAWSDAPSHHAKVWAKMEPSYNAIVEKYPKLDHKQRVNHLGNAWHRGTHFIEVCLDENENVWFLLHSGSRGVGQSLRHVLHRAGQERHAPVDDQSAGTRDPRLPAARHGALRGLRPRSALGRRITPLAQPAI
jgi:tRNA-splicing ligase RtcB